MQEKKTTVFKTPDITKMQEVVINPQNKDLYCSRS